MPADDDDDNNDEDFDELNSSTNSGIVIADDLVLSEGSFFQQKTQGKIDYDETHSYFQIDLKRL